jgi:LacI family transcriptional regulator
VSATIRDVAREAGVSVATVSRVFNNSGPVREDTRRRIDDVARRLRYIPNSAARTLSTRRTQTVGVVLPDLYGEFFSEVIRGIDQVVQESGWHLLVSSSHNERAEIEAALRAMRGRVDGLIVMSPDLDATTLSRNLPESLPVVLLNCESGRSDL